MPIFRSERGALHYDELGEGRPLLLLHGFTNFGLSWAPQLAPLVHAGHCVIVPDLPGHGRSAPAAAPCSVAALAAVAATLLDHRGIERVTVCGLSLGGMIAQQMAVDQPARIAKLVVVNSRSSFTGPAFTAMVDGWNALFREAQGPLKRLAATWPMLVNDAFRDSPGGRAVLEAWAEVLAAVSGSSLGHIAQGMTEFDLRGRLATIRAPTLVICGEEDRLFSPDDGRAIADEIAGSAYALIPGAGHLCNLDSADQFNRLLRDFLAA